MTNMVTSLLYNLMFIFLIPDISDSIIQLICVAKATGLGLLIKGGANRADGPMVFIQDLMPGGDCQKVVLLFSEFHNCRISTHEPD